MCSNKQISNELDTHNHGLKLINQREEKDTNKVGSNLSSGVANLVKIVKGYPRDVNNVDSTSKIGE